MNDLVAEKLRKLNPWIQMDWPETCRAAADHIEAQNRLIQELASELDNGVELLEVIKEHWIDYDHIYSIFAHEAKELASRALSKSNPNTPERNDK